MSKAGKIIEEARVRFKELAKELEFLDPLKGILASYM